MLTMEVWNAFFSSAQEEKVLYSKRDEILFFVGTLFTRIYTPFIGFGAVKRDSTITTYKQQQKQLELQLNITV